MNRTRKTLSPWCRILLLLGAVALAGFATIAAERASDGAREAEAPYETEARALKQRALELEAELHRVREREIQLRWEQDEARMRRELERLLAEADRLAASGHEEEAARVRRETEDRARQIDLEARRFHLERQRARRTGELELAFRSGVLEAEALESAGEKQQAAAVWERIEGLWAELEELPVEFLREEAEIERHHLTAQIVALEEEKSRLDELHQVDEGQRVAHLIQQLRAQRFLSAAEHLEQIERLSLEARLKAREAEIRSLVVAGEEEEAAQLRDRLAAETAYLEALNRDSHELRLRAEAAILRAPLEARLEVLRRLAADREGEAAEELAEKIRELERELDEIGVAP